MISITKKKFIESRLKCHVRRIMVADSYRRTRGYVPYDPIHPREYVDNCNNVIIERTIRLQ